MPNRSTKLFLLAGMFLMIFDPRSTKLFSRGVVEKLEQISTKLKNDIRNIGQAKDGHPWLRISFVGGAISNPGRTHSLEHVV